MSRSLPLGVVCAVFALLLGNADRAFAGALGPWLAAIPTKPPKATPPAAAGRAARTVPAWATLSFVEVARDLEAPIAIAFPDDGTGRAFLVEQGGKVWVQKDGAPRALFLDARSLLGARGGEQGLLGLAFHPRFQDNGALFIAYTDKGDDDAYARLVVDKASPDAVDAKAAQVLFSIDDPAGNHNGGHVLFGPDGKLWLGTGDGGAANNLFKTARNPQSLLGKMLRLDVDTPGASPEIWAQGLRNPWRYAFDRDTGDLWIADVGQNTWEEIDVVAKADQRPGLDFGWSRYEGFACFEQRPCEPAGFVMPVFAYSHDEGCSVTGGVVGRGGALAGTYVFGDYCTGTIWGIKKDGAGYVVAVLARTKMHISSFGQDPQGRVYVVDHDGAISRIEAK